MHQNQINQGGGTWVILQVNLIINLTSVKPLFGFSIVFVENSYRFITIYKSTYEFICLESHVNTEINLDLRVSNIPGYSVAEG